MKTNFILLLLFGTMYSHAQPSQQIVQHDLVWDGVFAECKSSKTSFLLKKAIDFQLSKVWKFYSPLKKADSISLQLVYLCQLQQKDSEHFEKQTSLESTCNLSLQNEKPNLR